ncbi:MAG: radical SAM protein, partial [Acidobacteria bacterium]
MVALSRGIHGWSKIAWGFLATDHPLLAHLIPIRRCNL